MSGGQGSAEKGHIRIAIWLPSDIPVLELALCETFFRQVNLTSDQNQYQLGLIRNTTHNDALSLFSEHMPCWEWTDHFDILLIMSNLLPVENISQETLQLLQNVLSGNEIPLITVNTGIMWLIDAGLYQNFPVVVHWEHWDEIGESYPRCQILPQLYMIADSISLCAGKLTLVDFLHEWISHRESSRTVNMLADQLCIDRVRSAEEKQRLPAVTLGGDDIQPRITMAIELMENNIEEPLSTDEIAEYVYISRRQLERLFKRYLNVLPARYYLQLRLQRAQHLLRTTGKSIVQIGLVCGFSSGPHFSSSYKSYYGITPRDERTKRFRRKTSGENL
ncbi:GlxA family transcriptional regulator [Vibrio salinus]|uniref:GlxA family transcriptional regulator n=1 Tax=Vibrio salinus TaxID=2899784 RepID=UPI001E39DCDE|nr:helix-turn-helix domain-containing protein [Vibrio salinus]MCE0495860.1 helix-turn-helix domain-containing protein [Vibrio salinus]